MKISRVKKVFMKNSSSLEDVQSKFDPRGIDIDKVGVKDIRYPIVVLDKKNKTQHTVASLNMYVDLPHCFKGTHMSRFIEVLNECHGEMTVEKFPLILERMMRRFDATTAHLEVEFPYFIEKVAPVSKVRGLMEYQCRFSGATGKNPDFILGVEVPVSTLCPCSKEISEKGAHNQRGIVKIGVRFEGFVWIEDLIDIAERAASSPVYSFLKRSDEKFLTEFAYANPRFVEDVVREIALALAGLEGVTWARIEAENHESIHNHSAYACLEREY
jgi:GTP cyclohydrolase I